MDVINIIILIVALINLILGVYAFRQAKNNEVNRIFSYVSYSVVAWCFTMAIYRGTVDVGISIFWAKLLYLSAACIAYTFLLFTFIFPDEKYNIDSRYKIFISIPFVFIVIACLMPGWVIKDVVIRASAEKQIIFGSIYFWIYLFYIPFYFGLAFLNLIKKYFRFNGLVKMQSRYIFIGSFFASSLGMITNLVLPTIGIFTLNWLGQILTIIFVGSIIYAILRYRLMDIRIVIKRGAIFSGLVVVVTAAYVFFAFLLGWAFFGGAYTFKLQLITGLTIAIGTAVGFTPLTNWLRKSMDKFLFTGTYNPQELLSDISGILSRTLDLDKVVKILQSKISRALRLSKMEVLILSGGNIVSKKNGTQKEKEATLSLNKIINYFVGKQKEILILEELRKKRADKVKFHNSFLLVKNIETIGFEAVAPLYVRNELVGLFLLGGKKSGDTFSVEDVKILEMIAGQAAIAMENARLYDQMKDFSQALQIEVRRQTKDLREANEKLKELDNAKTLFVSLASHQLRTPLTAILGYASMLLEGSYGEITSEQAEQLRIISISAERLIKLADEILTISQIELGRFEFRLEKVSLTELLQDLVREFGGAVKKKGLYLNYEASTKPLSLVMADALKIRQVFQNLIDNAIHYTEKGGITIGIKQAENKIIISVKDTGVGISAENKRFLFEKFSRGQGANKLFTEGAGLGLYFAAKIVKAHQGGDIWVESEGEGKGSSFFVSLPMGEK